MYESLTILVHRLLSSSLSSSLSVVVRLLQQDQDHRYITVSVWVQNVYYFAVSRTWNLCYVNYMYTALTQWLAIIRLHDGSREVSCFTRILQFYVQTRIFQTAQADTQSIIYKKLAHGRNRKIDLHIPPILQGRGSILPQF